jgi:large repetitive protein
MLGYKAFFTLLLVLFSQWVKSQSCALNYPAALTICPNQNVPIAPTSISGYNSFSWSGMTTITNSNQSTPLLSANSTGTLVLNATGPSCPPQTVTIGINLLSVVSPLINVSTALPVCSGSQVSASVTNPQPNTTYTWTFPGGSTAVGTSATRPALSPPGNGTVNQNLTVSALNSITGCITTATQSISLRQSPDPTISDFLSNSPFNSCDGSNFNLTVTNTSSTIATNTSYSINWGDGSPVLNLSPAQFPSNTDQVHIYNSFGFFDIIYTVSGSNGCSISQTYQVFSGTNPSIGGSLPSGTVGVCAPMNISFEVSSFGGNSAGTTYQIDYNDGSPSDNFTHPPPALVTHTFDTTSCGAIPLTTGNNVFQIRIRASNPCSSTDVTLSPITVNQKPHSDFNAPTQACANTNVNFVSTTTAGTNIVSSGNNFNCNVQSWQSWQVTPAAGWTVSSGSLGTPPPTANPTTQGSSTLGLTFTAPGVYQVKLYSRSSCGTDSITKTICIQTQATANVSLTPTTGCSPLAVSTTNSSTGNAICGVLNHTWTVAPLTGWAFTNNTNATSAEPRFTFTATGSYTVTYTVSNGCGNQTFTQNITVVAPPTVLIDPITPDCAPTSFSPSATVDAGGGTISSYAWTFPNGSPNSSTSASPSSITYSSAGTPTIQLAVTNQCGTTNASLPITIPNPPADPIITGTSPLCEGQTATMQVSNPELGVTYQWTGPSSYSASGISVSIPNIQTNQAGLYTVIASAGSCNSLPANYLFEVNPLPNLSVSPANAAICPGDSILLTPSGADSYTWNAAPELQLNGTGAFVFPNANNSYTVIGQLNSTGCLDSLLVPVNLNVSPIVEAGPNQNLCLSTTDIQLGGFSPTGGIFSSTSSIPLSPGGLITPDQVGQFWVYYTYTNPATFCSSIDSLILTISNASGVDVGDDLVLCINEPDLQLNGNLGTWSGSTFVSAGGIFQPSQVGVYNLEYTEGFGSCAVTDELTVTVSALPNISINALSSALCQGDTLLLTASGGDQYQWDAVPYLIDISGSTAFAWPMVDTVIHVIGQDTNGCIDTAEFALTIQELPNLSFNDTSFCNTTDIQELLALPVGGTFSGNYVTSAGEFTPVQTTIILYSYTDLNGCTASENATVNVSAAAIANAGADVALCFNEPGLQLNAFPNDGLWTSNAILSPSGFITASQTGIYEAIYTRGEASCTARDTLQITINELPNLTISTSPELCFGQAGTTLMANSVTADAFSWLVMGNSTILSSDAAFYVQPNDTTTYAVSAEISSTSCTVRDTIVVIVNPTPITAFTLGNSFCSSEDIQPINLSTTNPLIYNWEITGPQNLSLSDESPSFTNLAEGAYEIRLITSTGLCADTSSIALFEVVDPPVVTLAIGSYDDCSGNGIPITGSVVGSELAYAYTWQFGDFLTLNSEIPGSIDFPEPVLNDTLIQFQLSALGTICPAVSATGMANIRVKPNFRFLQDVTNGCSIFEIALPAEIIGLPTSIQLSLENGFTTNNPDYVFSFSAPNTPTSFLVYAEVSNDCGISLDTAQVNVIPNPVIPAVITDMPAAGICEGSFTSFTSISNGSVDSVLTYLWGVDGIPLIGGTQSFSYAFDTPGTYEVFLSVTDGCSDTTLVIPINVIEQPEVSLIVPPTTACENEIINVVSNGVNADLYQWTTGDGQAYYGQTASFAYSDAGDYLMTILVSDSAGVCTASASANIEIYPSPTVEAFVDEPGICTNEWVQFTSISEGATSFNWDFGNTANSIEATDSTIYSVPGSYTAHLTAFNFAGCSTVDSVDVFIFPLPLSRPEFSSNAGPNLCGIPVNVTLENNSQGALAYQWFVDGTYINNLFQPEIILNQYGIQTITLIANTQFGCSDTAEINVNVNIKPNPFISVSDPSGCQPHTATLSPACADCEELRIQIGGFMLNEGFDPITYTWEAPDNYIISCVGQNEFGCTDTAFIPVDVFPNPVADFSVSPPVMQDLSEVFDFTDLSEPNGELSYAFFFNESDISNLYLKEHAINLVTQPVNEILYTLVVATNHGCRDTAYRSVEINLISEVFIPNTFSPNGDGLNDYFWMKGNNLRTINLTVFTRWGEAIYEYKEGDPDFIGWDGLPNKAVSLFENAEPVIDVYYAVFEYNFENDPLTEPTRKKSMRVTIIK